MMGRLFGRGEGGTGPPAPDCEFCDPCRAIEMPVIEPFLDCGGDR